MTILDWGRQLLDRAVGSERAIYPRRVAVDAANRVTVDFVRSTRSRCIAEIGIFKGHTSMELARFLDNEGELHLFDYADRVEEVSRMLAAAGFRNVRTFGSSYKMLDSYNWQLAALLEHHREPIYDYVFLDGAHTWAVDALTTLLVDKLLKVGGYIDFDDYDWTLERSPALNPRAFPLTAKLYTKQQIAAPQVKMIIDLLVRRNASYVEVVQNKIFQKVA